MKLIILGSGTSHGIPVIGCSCPICTSSDSKDKRMRCSLYVEGAGGERAVIDTGPEFRLQALREGITRLDAIFLTHAHADHIHGLDDIRPLCRDKPMPVYGNSLTLSELKERFSYIWRKTQDGGGKPHIELKEAIKALSLGNLIFTPIPVKHGEIDILGWKITEIQDRALNETQDRASWNAVYLTDCTNISEDSFALIAQKGPPELLIIDGLRVNPHETHFSFEQALEMGLRIGARQVYLTHICHAHSNREVEEYCRDFAQKHGIRSSYMGPAWDGLVINLE